MSGIPIGPSDFPCIVQGYLKKLKRNLHWFLPSFTTRWFVLDFAMDKIYYTRCSRSSKIIHLTDFKEILQVNPDPWIKKHCDWSYAFQVRSVSRDFNLYCNTEESFWKWVKAFQTIQAVNRKSRENSLKLQRVFVSQPLCSSLVNSCSTSRFSLKQKVKKRGGKIRKSSCYKSELQMTPVNVSYETPPFYAQQNNMSVHLNGQYGNLVLKLIMMCEQKILSFMKGMRMNDQTWNQQLKTVYWNMQKIETDSDFSLKLSSGFSQLASFITKTSVYDLLGENSRRFKQPDLRMYEQKEKKNFTPILSSNPSRYHLNLSQREISPNKQIMKPRRSPAVRYKKVSPNYYQSIMNNFLSEFRPKPKQVNNEAKFNIQSKSQSNSTEFWLLDNNIQLIN